MKRILPNAASWIVPFVMATSAQAQVANTGTSAPPESAAAPAPEAADIIVTAQRRSEKLQDVPIAITAVTGTALAAANVRSVQDLTRLVSGFIGPGDIGFNSPHLRGIGSQISSPGTENSVALYVDGVYIGATSPALLRLSSVEQAEVLKGPQGTLFGRNTTGGLVQINTRNPSQKFETDLEATYANYETGTGSIYVNAPISENVATNFAGQISGAGKGWGTNEATGSPTYQLKTELSLRNKWDISLGANTKLFLMADYERHNDLNYFESRSVYGQLVAPGYRSTVTGYDTNSASDVYVRSSALGLLGRISQDFGFATLSNTFAYRDTRFDLLNFVANYAPSPYDSIHFFEYTTNRQYTDELQLSSNGHGPLKWTAGIFGYDDTAITHLPGITGPAGPPFDVLTDTNIKTKSIAVYGQASYEITPATTLTAGLRYSTDRHSVTGSTVYTPTVFSFLNATSNLAPFTDSSVSFRAAVSQKLSPDVLIYASFNRGSKSGGFSPVQVNNPPFAQEKLNDYEIGTKTSFFDHKLRINLAGFYYQYSNIQVESFKSGGPPTFYNAGSAKLYGVDADVEVRPTHDLTISGTASYVHSAFGDFPSAEYYAQCSPATALNGQCIPPYAAVGAGYYIYNANARGNELPQSPKFTGSVAVNYRIPVSFGKFDLDGTYSYNGGFFTTVANDLRQPAFSKVSASAQFTTLDERYYVRGWVANLTNTMDTSGLYQVSSGQIVRFNAPRTYGLTIGVKLK